jgi:hypothetical protein
MTKEPLKITKKRRKGEDGYKVFSVRIKESTLSDIEKIALETDRSRNEIINLLLEYGIANSEITSSDEEV